MVFNENLTIFQTQLEILDLSHNNLGRLGVETLYGLESLLSLRLNHNSLTQLPANLTRHCPGLRHLGETFSHSASCHENTIMCHSSHKLDFIKVLLEDDESKRTFNIIYHTRI